MDLPRNGREWYDLGFTRKADGSPIEGPWQANFTGQDDDWIDGLETSEGSHAWLVAGPDFNAASVGMSDSDTAATIADETDVMVRLKDNPVLTLRHGPPIRLVC